MGCHGGSRCLRFFVTTIVAVAGLAGLSTRSLASPLVVTPSAYLSEQYNDNIFFNDEHMDDYITNIGIGLSAQYSRPRFTASLSSGTSAQYFAKNSSESGVAKNQAATLSMTYQASPILGLTLSDSLARVSSTRTGSVLPASEAPPNVEQPPPSTQASTLLPRGDAFSNYFASGATYQFYPRWSAGLNYSNGVSDFTNPGGHELTNAVAGTLGYAWSPILGLSASFSYSRFSASQAPDTESYSPNAGFSYQYDPTLSLGAYAGVYVNRPLGGGSDSISTGVGPTFSISLNKRFELSSVNLGGSQSVSNSAGVAGTSITDAAYLYYNVALSEHLSGSLGTSYSHFDTSQTNFDVLYVTAALSYPLWRYFSTGVSYSYVYRFADQSTSTLNQGSVDDNLVQIYISASYPVWRGDL